jgi:hypothetical protein
MQNVLTFPAFNEGQSAWFIFKGISPNHTIGCNLFETKTFHKSNENLYAPESGHSCSQFGHTHCQLFFKEALFRNSSCILCFRKQADICQFLVLAIHYDTDFGHVKITKYLHRIIWAIRSIGWFRQTATIGLEHYRMREPTAGLKDQNSLKPKTRVHLFKKSVPTLQITGSFPEAKLPGSGVDHAPHSRAAAANVLELHLRLPSVPAYASHGVTSYTYITENNASPYKCRAINVFT